ncbi:MAG: sigma-70 family RNA polymerase sigma factor [Abitibacteriaceae bacterium]|nr:sigma-70 family RNA polymerase sigma factor [Abditibacteriaceae bacterium]MBV9865711.1 sigma-70 family RNA polymerase sigma factor [Abditibacteriaceae bacterium]
MQDAHDDHSLAEQHQLFEQHILPHLDAAYNLARWLTRNEQDAEDVVQEACLRAFRFLGGFRGGDSRAWLLAIVRHSCYTWLRQHREQELMTPWDEACDNMASDTPSPETMLMQKFDVERLREALEGLPVEFREVVVLRDLEGLSYKEIAHIAEVPIGTVMSRLARARKRLQPYLKSRWDDSCWDKEFPVEL